MKKFICAMLILCAAVPLIFAGGNKDKGSNRIVIYTSMYKNAVDSLEKDLKKKFPQYYVDFIHGETGLIQARVANEHSTGTLGCDILMVADPAYSLELKEKGMLHPFKSKESANLAFDYDPAGYWYPVRVSNMVLAFNPDKNRRDNLPSSFNDFAHNTRVRGAISMRNPLVSGTTMAAVTALRDKYGYDFFDALGKQKVKIDYGADDTLAKLESGECMIAMILEESILRKRQQEKSKLEVIYPSDGAVVIPSPIMIINNKWNASKNTEAAEVIAEWFLSAEGQKAIVDAWMHSVRKDFPNLPFDSKPTQEIRDSSLKVSWENIFRQKDEIHKRFEEYIAAGR